MEQTGPRTEAMSNGDVQPGSQSMTPSGLPRDELLRLLVQCLDSLGFSEVAQQLEAESGVRAFSSLVQAFRVAVLGGQWAKLEELLPEMDDKAFKSREAAQNARFALYEQKFLEVLETRDIRAALDILQNEVTPCALPPSTSETDDVSPTLSEKHPGLQRLAMALMSQNFDEVRESMKLLPGQTFAGTRDRVLQGLQQLVLPSMLLPENRLETLLLRQLERQRVDASWPFVAMSTSSRGLLEDLQFSQDQVPSVPKFRLDKAHEDEVWFVAFNHAGDKLASASKDRTAIIWDVKPGQAPKVLHTLKGYREYLSYLAWSPDDSKLLVCGNDVAICLWDANSGNLIETYRKHADPVTAVAWLPGSKQFVSGSLDKTVRLWDIEAPVSQETRQPEPIHEFDHGARVNDIGISKDGSVLVAICSDNNIRTYDMSTRKEILGENNLVMREPANKVTSCALSDNGEMLLVNVSSQDASKVHCWDIKNRLVNRQYVGLSQNRFVIRPCFGGDGAFVVSGSEDGQILIFHRDSCQILHRLRGHAATVNSVSWHPTNKAMLASASDDKSIIIWGM